MNSRLCAAALLFAAGILSTGCGGKTGHVTGKVTIEGQPLVAATVSFEDTVQHIRSSGVTNAAGVYSLSTNSKDDGAPVGDYKIAVIQAGPVNSNESEPPRQFAKNFENCDTSGLTYSVKSGKQVHNIQLPRP